MMLSIFSFCPIFRLGLILLLLASSVLSQAKKRKIDLNRSPQESSDTSPVEGIGSLVQTSQSHSYPFDAEVDTENKVAKVRKQSYYTHLKQINPKAAQALNRKQSISRRKKISNMQGQKLVEYYEKKRDQERKRYHKRKRESGFGNKYERDSQIVREKIADGTATPEDISFRQKYLEKKRQMLRYAANEDQSDEVNSTRLKGKKLTEHPSQSTKSSMEISRKRIIQQRYMKKLKVCHPEKVKNRDKRHYERKKEALSKLTEEELISWKEGKRLEDKIQYRMRDLKRGYGRKQNESIKEIRRKVQQNQASPEEISKLNKLRQQKIKSYHSIKAKKASQKS